MSKFHMRLPAGMLDRLEQETWWQDLLRFRDEGQHLFVGIRDGYLSVYLRGRAIFKKIKQTQDGSILASFDNRYLFGPSAASGDLFFDGKTIRTKAGAEVVHDDGPLAFDRWARRVKTYNLVNLDDETTSTAPDDRSEKACLAPRALNPSVVNLEMALPGVETKEGRIAPRIDLVHLEVSGSGAVLVFTEAKLFSNTKSLRTRGDDRPAKVVDQIHGYRSYLEAHHAVIETAYRQACPLLVQIRKQQQVPVHELLEAVSTGGTLSISALPRILIFRTKDDAGMSNDSWEAHQSKIAQSGIDIEIAHYSS